MNTKAKIHISAGNKTGSKDYGVAFTGTWHHGRQLDRLVGMGEAHCTAAAGNLFATRKRMYD